MEVTFAERKRHPVALDTLGEPVTQHRAPVKVGSIGHATRGLECLGPLSRQTSLCAISKFAAEILDLLTIRILGTSIRTHPRIIRVYQIVAYFRKVAVIEPPLGMIPTAMPTAIPITAARE